MKKKVINALICVAVAVLVVLLCPAIIRYKDGGSIEYKSITYSVKKHHSIMSGWNNQYIENWYLVGYTVEIFGKEVFDNSHTDIECDEFSFDEVCSFYENETVGVKRDGFVNTEKTEIKNAEQAVELAKKECKTEYETIRVGYDKKQRVYSVSFGTLDVDGGNVAVYIDGFGVTRLVVAGE